MTPGDEPPVGAAGPPPHRGRARFWTRLLDPTRAAVKVVEKGVEKGVERGVVPVWQQVKQGESRGPVTVAIAVAIAIQVLLPDRVASGSKWAVTVLAVLLLVGIVVTNPHRIDRRSPALRAATLVLTLILSGVNMSSAARLVVDLVHAEGIREPVTLLLAGSGIWLTNVIVFSLWYWQFDRGGPVARALGVKPYPDFLFPQQATPGIAPAGWEATFVDYLYLSFTNATAFSPTDVMPLSRWAKLTMLVQSAASLVVVALVVARAVNVLR